MTPKFYYLLQVGDLSLVFVYNIVINHTFDILAYGNEQVKERYIDLLLTI